jgi:hypothetical protein
VINLEELREHSLGQILALYNRKSQFVIVQKKKKLKLRKASIPLSLQQICFSTNIRSQAWGHRGPLDLRPHDIQWAA